MDISIIVPTLNEENYIEECLSSIHSQNTDLDYEVIVCDGKSKDKTVEIAENYADRVIISNKRSIGIQRNKGVEKANADHLLFVDANTILPPNYLEQSKTKFEKDPNLLGFSAAFMFSERNWKLVFSEKIVNSYFIFKDKIGSADLPRFNINVRRSAFDSIGGFKDIPLEDADFSIELREIGKTRYFDDFYVITSARRLEEMGILKTVRYYADMDLLRKSPMLRTIPEYRAVLTYNDYVSCRIKYSSLRKGFPYDEVRPIGLKLNKATLEYIGKRVDLLPGIFRKSVLSKKQWVENIARTSRSIADLRLKSKIGKREINEAIEHFKEKIKNI